MRQSLLSFDTDRIKEYVFATDLLKEIRGASAILTRLNEKEMPRCVGGTCYYAHGGSGLFLVPSQDAADCIARVRQAYAEATGGAVTITGVALELPETFDVEQGDIRPFWKHLGYKLKAAKARNPEVRTSVSHPLLRFGESDGTFYATRPDPDDPNDLISTVSYLKRQCNYALRDQAQRKGSDLPDDFAAIASVSSPQNYFAVIYADGDSLGEALDECMTLSKIKTVARGIDTILQSVKDEALARHGLASQHCDTLMHGGDDLIIAVPAHTALKIALDITEGFQQRTQESLDKAYTVSTAIVWAHTAFPFGVWHDIADSALKFAKREGAKRKLKGLVNFLAISSANHLDFASWYRQVLTSREEPPSEKRIVRTLRPYTTTRLRELMRYRQTLRRVPRSKLEALRQAVFQPRTRATFEALRVLVHWRGDDTRMAIQQMVDALVAGCLGQPGTFYFPFVEVKDMHDEVDELVTLYCTPIADLAEIWDFIPGGIDEN